MSELGFTVQVDSYLQSLANKEKKDKENVILYNLEQVKELMYKLPIDFQININRDDDGLNIHIYRVNPERYKEIVSISFYDFSSIKETKALWKHLKEVILKKPTEFEGFISTVDFKDKI